MTLSSQKNQGGKIRCVFHDGRVKYLKAHIANNVNHQRSKGFMPEPEDEELHEGSLLTANGIDENHTDNPTVPEDLPSEDNDDSSDNDSEEGAADEDDAKDEGKDSDEPDLQSIAEAPKKRKKRKNKK